MNLKPAVINAQVVNMEQGECLPGWDLDFMQISHGQIQGTQAIVSLPGLQLIRERYEGVVLSQRGVAPGNSVLIGLPIAMSGPAMFNGVALHQGVCIAPGDREYQARLPPHEVLCIVLDRGLLAQYIRDTEGVDVGELLSKRMLLAENRDQIAEVLARARGVPVIGIGAGAGVVHHGPTGGT